MLNKKSILITGANRGIGLQLVKESLNKNFSDLSSSETETIILLTASCWIKVIITFFVPFFVSIISSALATNSEKSV